MDRAQLADFLRTRREALHPEDVGLPPGQRRRTGGLRREEVAVLCQMSTDYYSRLEQQRGTRPSEQMLNAIARGLRLSLEERDHLFRLAGRNTPQRTLGSAHVNPGLMRILDRLSDTPAEVITGLAEIPGAPCLHTCPRIGKLQQASTPVSHRRSTPRTVEAGRGQIAQPSLLTGRRSQVKQAGGFRPANAYCLNPPR
jgi:transcriptional regulator with XRE-family HTH domain